MPRTGQEKAQGHRTLMKDPSPWETVEYKAQERTSKIENLTKYLKCYKRENMLNKN